RRQHTATLIEPDTEWLEPRRRARLKAERDDHRIGGQNLLGARHDLRPSPPVAVGLPQPGVYHFHTLHLSLAYHRHGVPIVLSLNALSAGSDHLRPVARHVVFITPIGAGHHASTLTYDSTVASHGGIAAAQYHDLPTFKRAVVTRVAGI